MGGGVKTSMNLRSCVVTLVFPAPLTMYSSNYFNFVYSTTTTMIWEIPIEALFTLMFCAIESFLTSMFQYSDSWGKRGDWGHFWMFGSYESIFITEQPLFVERKLSRRVKKLSIFEDRPSDNLPIEIYRRNLVKIWYFWSIFFCFWP